MSCSDILGPAAVCGIGFDANPAGGEQSILGGLKCPFANLGGFGFGLSGEHGWCAVIGWTQCDPYSGQRQTAEQV
jgi:hypothetical protein